jgi:tetratricopeptide (TPR) repeat protein/pimeloyl-ACP methyl ester carboxylesterase
MIDADLVFIHGFWSEPSTWDRLIRRAEADEDLRGLRIHPFGYESPKVPRPGATTRIPDYDDIAQSLPAFLRHRCQGDTAIVTHSQGGLILQRYLAWMLDHGRGRELARIKLIAMLACPNEGSEYLGTIRSVAGFGWHPQARDLKVLSGKVIETRQKVVDRVIYADGVDDYRCHIPIYVYAGRTDNIVKRETAQSIFPYAESLPGNHSSILDPDVPGHLTFEVIKGHLLDMPHTEAVNSAVPQVPEPDDTDLKAITRHFTGRQEQIDVVKDELNEDPDPRAIRSVFLIHGMPGIGKSALAGYLAHQIADEFRDPVRRAGMKQIIRQVDLPGLAPLGWVDPGQVLRGWLSSAYKPQEIPADISGIAALWRRHLAGQNAFLVLLLDDAGDADQILPFLPGRPGYVVLVTSRRALPDFVGATGTTPINLGVMDEATASDLIRNVARRGVDNKDDEPIREIANLCGRHPLAMTLAVAPLAGRPEISFAERLVELQSRPKRLSAIDEYLSGENRGVAQAFELSYTQLPEACQLLLRRLSLAPVPAVGADAAAVLNGSSIAEVGPQLRKLESEALISRHHSQYRLHDLIRDYARNLADEDDPADNAAAISRLLGYYYAAAAYVDGMLTRQPAPRAIEPPYPGVRRELPSRQSAIAWARDELPSFRALADYVAHEAEGGDEAANAWVVLFASALAGLLRNDGFWLESIDLQSRAIAAAVQLDEPLAEANALHERAMLYRLSAQLDNAIPDLDRALALYRSIGGEPGAIGAAHAQNTYAVVLDQSHQSAAAKEQLDQAMAGYRRLGDRLGEANVLHDQGMKEYFAGQHAAAADLLSQALAVYQEIDHPLGQAHARLNLARAERKVGREPAAKANLVAARELYHELGNELGEATILVELGEVQRTDLKDQSDEQAVRDLREAERISEKIGNQLVHGTAVEQLGEFCLAKGDQARAVTLFRQALQIYRENGIGREEKRFVQRLISLGLLDEVDTSGE